MSGYIRQIREQPSDPLGGASGEKSYFTVDFLGKRNNPDFPFTIANEVVATQIGLALGLNLPTVITHHAGGETVALIQMIGRASSMQRPPPATAEALRDYVEKHPRKVHGAIVFDLYVANNDRAFGPMRRNLMLDERGSLLLYDQGNACFYRPRPNASIEPGVPRLDAVEADLTAMFDMDHKENHYREFLTDPAMVRQWCDRVETLPDYLVEAAVDRIPAELARPTKQERERLKEFLLARRRRLFDDIMGKRDFFPGLQEPPRG